jgi:hypothetical protein
VPFIWAHVYNIKMDNCMFSGEQEMDPKKRAEIYQKCENILYEDAFQGGIFIRSNLITLSNYDFTG